MGCFWITFILLWWDFLKPALFNSGDAVLVFWFFYENHYHLLYQNMINLTFQHFPSEQDSTQQTWWYSCWNVRCLTKCLIRQFKKNTLCKRRLKYTDCHTRCRNFHVTNKQLFGFTMSSEGSDVAITRSGLECCSEFGSLTRKTTIRTVVLTQCLG